jgi:ubiquinone/menaquinone biosynthesis C-methylase UbiE
MGNPSTSPGLKTDEIRTEKDGNRAMETLLAILRAAAEPTRLRLLALCAEGDMAVGDLVEILGQSQPRVSRHLKLLCEAGALDRFREGSRVFYRLSDDPGEPGAVARTLAAMIPVDDPEFARDRDGLAQIRERRAAAADAYFRANAAQWDQIRSLHVDEREVERALRAVLPGPCDLLLDIGTGTGSMLSLFADRYERGVGIDASRDMLAMARANLDGEGLRHCHVRHGDMYRLPFEDGAADAVIVHQVLHYADRPGAVIAEAARVLAPGGTLVVADFAPHEQESLRDSHTHQRLGFEEAEIFDWCRAAKLAPGQAVHLAGDPLTVTIWTAHAKGALRAIPGGAAAREAVS